MATDKMYMNLTGVEFYLPVYKFVDYIMVLRLLFKTNIG